MYPVRLDVTQESHFTVFGVSSKGSKDFPPNHTVPSIFKFFNTNFYPYFENFLTCALYSNIFKCFNVSVFSTFFIFYISRIFHVEQHFDILHVNGFCFYFIIFIIFIYLTCDFYAARKFSRSHTGHVKI